MRQTPNSQIAPLTEHLDELRTVIFRSCGYLLAGCLVGFIVARRLITFLVVPSVGSIPSFVFVKPVEIAVVYVKVALYAGIILAAPFIAWQVWRFVEPAVAEPARRHLWRWAGAATALFAAGTAFAYFIALPSAIRVLLALATGLAEPMITLNSYISFVLAVLLMAGAVFEIPVIAGLLTTAGIITPTLLRARRKEALFGLCIIAAVVTPTTDIVNLLMFVIPMALLYELGIVVSSLLYNPPPVQPGEEAYLHET